MSGLVQAKVVISHPQRRRGDLVEVAPDDPGFTSGYLQLVEPAGPVPMLESQPEERPRRRVRKAAAAAQEGATDAGDSQGDDPGPS